MQFKWKVYHNRFSDRNSGHHVLRGLGVLQNMTAFLDFFDNVTR